MARPPELTDRTALARNLARATATFLQDEAILNLQERLEEVNRTFTDVAVVTGFPDLWQRTFPQATVVPDDETLALTPGSFDLVIHAFGLHWANDLVGQLVQCRRALRPDGLFLGVLFGGRTLAELRAALAEAEARISGGLSPRVLPMGEIRELGGLLQRAGFALPVADGDLITVTYASALHLMRDLRAMGEANAMAARRRAPTRRALFAEAGRVYAESYPAADGRIRASFELIFLTGWAPHESQQKPLRPGSAVTRLSDALGAPETPLPRDDGAASD
ncbi:MAG: methyltransferase domain-containing protein [Rhodobacteraceae bacterium]|nr:methyltransferase domain-containing protein [Paracoccaceae bacterium]